MVKYCLFWCLALLTGLALAGDDLTRIGNRTIERVRVSRPRPAHPRNSAIGPVPVEIVGACEAKVLTSACQTVQLRTHSLYAPYVDQDLQNRWWDFGGDAYVVRSFRASGDRRAFG
jgi:hypothetical protein